MRTIGLTALLGIGLATSAMADGLVPEDYQGVWAAARDCKTNFQNVLAKVVGREHAVCRVTQVVSSGAASAIDLSCGGSASRETWHSETIEDTDYLVIVRSVPEAALAPSIELYKRCPGIPLGAIQLSEIPGNPLPNAASEEKVAPPRHSPPIARQRAGSRSATRTRKPHQ